MTHLIDRTSPKGERFVGTCRYCHEVLEMSQVNEECPDAPTNDQAIIDSLEES